MGRTKVNQLSEFPYHITSRTPNRVDFPLPLKRVWEILCEELFWVHKKYGFQIISFVLMPNHFHLLAKTNEVPLGKILNDFLRDSSKRINEEAQKINQNWGGAVYKTEISTMSYYFNAYRYVYQNPLRAGLCQRVEDYPYSTLYGLLGQSHLLIPLIEDSTLFDGDVHSSLAWLNQPQDKEQVEYLRMGLKYKTLKIKKDSSRRILLIPDTPPPRK